jgi:hypothetical protein
MAMPVSKPAWFVTNGNSRLQVQALMLNAGDGPYGWQKRGIGPAVAEGAVDSGAKLIVAELRAGAGNTLLVF